MKLALCKIELLKQGSIIGALRRDWIGVAELRRMWRKNISEGKRMEGRRRRRSEEEEEEEEAEGEEGERNHGELRDSDEIRIQKNQKKERRNE